MRRIISLALIVFALSACTTQKGAVKYFNNHPELSSEWCADKYPVRDSIAPPVVIYKPASNVDYSQAIDSINRAYSQLRRYADSVSLAASLDSSECGKKYSPIINRLNAVISGQAYDIKKLRDNYKKCEPDTAFILTTVYRENTARVKSLQLKIDDISTDNAINIKWKRFFMWWAIGATLIVVAGVAVSIIRR